MCARSLIVLCDAQQLMLAIKFFQELQSVPCGLWTPLDNKTKWFYSLADLDFMDAKAFYVLRKDFGVLSKSYSKSSLSSKPVPLPLCGSALAN